jgi:hypothetical protein
MLRVCSSDPGTRRLLTRTSSKRICVSEYEKVGRSLVLDVVPSVRFIMVKQRVFIYSVSPDTIIEEDVILRVDGCPVANTEWPIIVWSYERPPHATVQYPISA